MAKDMPITEAVEDAASERLGVRRRDRPSIFRESADAAVDNGLPYWTVLVLSGAIATLGLALDSSAVVIGAMLVAPLVAPIVGLALALAVGDARLAAQSSAVVLGSTVAVVLVAAALTAAIPFETITVEISSRTRPSVLDLGVAVFSGLVGAVVAVARGNRLSAAIPGVAVAVALIPPLAVAGFGMGAGWRRDIIGGSLLLFAASLAGIVLSGMLVFLLVGMHKPEVVAAARKWHGTQAASGLAAWVVRLRWIRSLGVFGSAWGRVLLALGFVALLAVPLTRTLQEITREARVRQAVASAAAVFERPGRASIIGQQITFGPDRSLVHLRVATADGYGDATRHAFERDASALAGEPVSLVLDQMPSTVGELEALRDLSQASGRPADAPAPGRAPAALSELLDLARGTVEDAVAALPFPPGTRPVAVEVRTGDAPADVVRVAYLAMEPIQPQAGAILREALRDALAYHRLELALLRIPLPTEPFDPRGTGAAYVPAVGEALRDHASLRVELLVPETPDSAAVAAVAAVRAALDDVGVDPRRIAVRAVRADSVKLRVASGSPRLEESDAALSRRP